MSPSYPRNPVVHVEIFRAQIGQALPRAIDKSRRLGRSLAGSSVHEDAAPKEFLIGKGVRVDV
jgi:hypothetical protein